MKISITLILISLLVASVYAAKSIDMELLKRTSGSGCTYEAVEPVAPDPDCPLFCFLTCPEAEDEGTNGYCRDTGSYTGYKVKNDAKQTDLPKYCTQGCGACLLIVCVGGETAPPLCWGNLTECELTSEGCTSS